MSEDAMEASGSRADMRANVIYVPRTGSPTKKLAVFTLPPGVGQELRLELPMGTARIFTIKQILFTVTADYGKANGVIIATEGNRDLPEDIDALLTP